MVSLLCLGTILDMLADPSFNRFIFAQSNNVILLDEFDGIMRDIKPFFALSPSVIKSRGLKLQKDNSTFTMELRSGDIEITGNHRLDGRAADQKKLMSRWSQWVADINITMSAHDGPSILLGNDLREKHETAAAKGVGESWLTSFLRWS